MRREARVRITARVKPRARRSAIVRAFALSIDVSLVAPPVDGAANEELVATVAAAIGVPKAWVTIVLGASARTKVLEVSGLDPTLVVQRLAAAASAT